MVVVDFDVIFVFCCSTATPRGIPWVYVHEWDGWCGCAVCKAIFVLTITKIWFEGKLWMHERREKSKFKMLLISKMPSDMSADASADASVDVPARIS